MASCWPREFLPTFLRRVYLCAPHSLLPEQHTRLPETDRCFSVPEKVAAQNPKCRHSIDRRVESRSRWPTPRQSQPSIIMSHPVFIASITDQKPNLSEKWPSAWWEMIMVCIWISLGSLFPSACMKGAGVYDLYCSLPLGGDPNDLASLLWNCYVIHLFIYSLSLTPCFATTLKDPSPLYEASFSLIFKKKNALHTQSFQQMSSDKSILRSCSASNHRGAN